MTIKLIGVGLNVHKSNIAKVKIYIYNNDMNILYDNEAAPEEAMFSRRLVMD